MPKFLQIPDFAKAGLNSDLMPWDLPGSFLTEMSNIRISRNKLSPFGGHSTWANLPVDFQPGLVHFVIGLSARYWLIPGRDAVYAYDGTSFHNVSNVDGYGGISDEDTWTGCMMGSTPVINNPGHYPEYWSPQNTAQPMQYLKWDATRTWKDAGENCKVVRSHKQFLFALDLQSGSEEIPDGVRWSSPADNQELPLTWDHLDSTNVAGFIRLGGAGGRIIDGLTLRDAFVVYRENSIHVFDYIGGQYVWRVRHLSSTIGSIAPDSIVEVKGRHYLIGDADILVNDGNSIKSILHGRLHKRFSANLDPDNFLNSYAVANDIANEIWFCVPSNGSVYADIAYIYNHQDDTWSVRDIPAGPSAAYGSQNTPQISWDTVEGKWETTPLVWNQSQASPLDETVVCATKPSAPGTSGKLYILDRNALDIDSPYEANIERVGFALEGLDDVTTITRVYPHMRGSGSVFIQVGSQAHPGAPVAWKGAVEYTPGKDRKVDVRSTGELHCFRIFSPSTTGYWEISGLDIEYVMAGKR